MSKPVSLFLIDDHTLFSQAFGAFIASCTDFHWMGSADGSAKSVTRVLQLNPQVLLLDYHLKEKSGLLLLQELRQKNFTGKIIFLTMNRERFIRESARYNGADGFVPKEADGELLLDAIRQLVAGHIDYLTMDSSSSGDTSLDLYGLTPQEKRITDMICSGSSSSDIARQLHISIHTVHTHRRRILEKTGSENFMQVREKLA